MFLDLPIELQHLIYDKLHVIDRFNLNIALSKHNIKKTSKTTFEKDKKLALCVKAFKYKSKYDPSKSDSIIRFIKSNIDEPTIKKIIQDENINITKTLLLQDMVKINDLSELDKITEINPETYHIIVENMKKYANPDTFKILYNHTKFTYFKTYFQDKYNIQNLFFSCVNYDNEKLLEYVKDRPEFSIGISYITSTSICTIFQYNLKCLQMLLKHFKLPEESISKIEQNAINNLDLDIYKFICK
jgi:hypothetical protein